MKYTRTAIGLLTRLYRSVLRKCWLINVGLFALATAAFTTVSPNEASASDSGVHKGDIDTYATDNANLWKFWYDKYTRDSTRKNYLDILTSYDMSQSSVSEYAHGSYFDLELALQDISSGRIFQSGAIGTHDIATGAITSTELASNAVTAVKIASNAVTTAKIASNAVTDAKIASGITASKITQTASERFVSDTEKSTWNSKATLDEVRALDDLNNYYTKYGFLGEKMGEKMSENEGENEGEKINSSFRGSCDATDVGISSHRLATSGRNDTAISLTVADAQRRMRFPRLRLGMTVSFFEAANDNLNIMEDYNEAI